MQVMLLNTPIMVTPETVGPWFPVLFFALMAGLPRLIAWILNAPSERATTRTD